MHIYDLTIPDKMHLCRYWWSAPTRGLIEDSLTHGHPLLPIPSTISKTIKINKKWSNIKHHETLSQTPASNTEVFHGSQPFLRNHLMAIRYHGNQDVDLWGCANSEHGALVWNEFGFFGYTTPTQIVQWSKKLKPSNIKGIPVKASFQLLGGFALVSTSQQFSCATSWMTLKTFFVFFLGAIAKAGKTMPLTHITYFGIKHQLWRGICLSIITTNLSSAPRCSRSHCTGEQSPFGTPVWVVFSFVLNALVWKFRTCAMVGRKYAIYIMHNTVQ